MPIRHAFVLSASVALAGVLLPSVSHAQKDAALPTSPPITPPVAEQHWSSVKCDACQKTGISFEFRQLSNQRHGAGDFIVARVRNLSPREVAGSIDVMEDDLPDSDSHVRSQTLWFVLGPGGKEGGEQIVLLRHSTPVQILVHGVTQ